jgi:hypothetical protein
MMAPQLLYRYGSISKHLVSILLANFLGRWLIACVLMVAEVLACLLRVVFM